jgi:hypothetical protein
MRAIRLVLGLQSALQVKVRHNLGSTANPVMTLEKLPPWLAPSRVENTEHNLPFPYPAKAGNNPEWRDVGRMKITRIYLRVIFCFSNG